MQDHSNQTGTLTHEELSEAEFIARFRPLPNIINAAAGFDGMLYDTFGAELAYVQAADPARVWTIIKNGDRLFILSGWHVVDRFGYLLTALPCPAGMTIEAEVET